MPDFHFQRGNKGCGQPSEFIFFDCETLGTADRKKEFSEHHSLRLGVAIAIRYYDGITASRQMCHFTTKEQFWAFVESRLRKRNPLWIVAHNAGFDLTIVDFWQLLADGVWRTGKIPTGKTNAKGEKTYQDLGFICIDDPPTIIKATHADLERKIVCVDSMNWFKTSLAKLGQSVGLEKQPMPAFDDPDSDWAIYCERDVEILERAFLGLLQWTKQNDLGNFKMTAPSQSFTAYKHRFRPAPICIHRNEIVKVLERDGYFGGRLELFRRGDIEGEVFGYDVRSMYPFIMRNRVFPCELKSSSDKSPQAKRDYTQFDRRTVAEVRIDSDSGTYPIRTVQGVIFARGNFWTTLSGPELERAAKAGHVTACRRWATYRLQPLFREFVDFFSGLRTKYDRAGNTLYATFAKLILNSNYGKWAQLGTEWEDRYLEEENVGFSHWEVDDFDTDTTTEFRILGRLVQEKVDRGELPESFVGIAGWVTAWAREYLLELIEAAGWKNVLYVVTDALYVNAQGKRRLVAKGYVADGQLGKLQLECRGRNARFEALHHFRCGTKQKFGSRKAKALEFPDGDVEEVKFEGLHSILRRPQTASVRVYQQAKTFSKRYTRAEVHADGSITPFTLTEDKIIRRENKLPDVSAFSTEFLPC